MALKKAPSVLAFERKLCPSDALMFSGTWDKRHQESNNSWKAIKVQHKDVRATISNRMPSKTASDPMKVNAEIQKPNLQSVDVASLPFDVDTLRIDFTLRVLGDIALPVVCNDQEYQQALFIKVNDYLNREKCTELAKRYTENLINGRALWRNRIGAEKIETHIKIYKEGKEIKSFTFDGKQYSLHQFSKGNDIQLSELAMLVDDALTGKSNLFVKVQIFALIGPGQEVFPSQELVLDDNNGKNKKSKLLYAVDDIAAIHSQKIGNAIRTIDTWYIEADQFGPIAIEPYGSVTSRGEAYRRPKSESDFYTLFDNWIIKDKLPSLEQQHYVIACLIRGGIFGEKD